MTDFPIKNKQAASIQVDFQTLVRGVVLLLEFSLACSALSPGDWDRSRIELTNNGYTGILVAIDRSVPYSEMFVENLKVVLSRASSVLYNATDNRVFFRDVTILVPRSWPEREGYQFAPNWVQDTTANVIISSTTNNTAFPPTSFVHQPGPCGQTGEYMHLPLEMFTSQSPDDSPNTAKVIVHEWGHLRWGLFDEYPLSDDTQFYISKDGVVKGTRCSEGITGRAVFGTSEVTTSTNSSEYWSRNRNRNQTSTRECHVEDGKLPPADCHFLPDPNDNQTASGSLMYSVEIPSVTGFCRSHVTPADDSDPSSTSTLHVPEAPTEQNRQCQGQSAWDVMLTSPDFEGYGSTGRDGSASGGSRGPVDTSPTFTFIYHKPRTVLLLDRTMAMGDGEAWRNAVSICERFISEASENSQVGLAFYYSIYPNMTAMVDMTPAGKRELLSVLNGMARHPSSDLSNLGPDAALLRLFRELITNGRRERAVGAQILLFSGWQGAINANKLNIIRGMGTSIEAVEFGTNSSDVRSISVPVHLEPIVLFSFDPPSAADDLDSGMDSDHHEYMFHNMENNQAFLQVFRKTVDLDLTAGQTIVTLDVAIDGTIGRFTTFRFSWEDGGTPDVRVTAPNGTIYRRSSSAGETTGGIARKEIDIRVPGFAESGTWRVTVSGPVEATIQTVDLQVFSAPSSPDALTIRANPLVLSRQARVSSRRPLILYGEVMQGKNPVVGANVTMTITDLQGERVFVTLRDNGIGGDTRKHDGIYSAYVTELTRNGTHRIDMNVVGDEFSEPHKSYVKVIRRPRTVNQPMSQENVAVEPFMRAPSQVEIEVLGDVASLVVNDSFPPARISDLQLVDYDASTREAGLSWTAVGDDYHSGTASRYEIRYSNDSRSFARSFANGYEISNDSFILGDPEAPATSLQVESMVIRLPANYCSPVCAIRLRAIDDEENGGEPSNMVTAVERARQTTTTTSSVITTRAAITESYAPGQTETETSSSDEKGANDDDHVETTTGEGNVTSKRDFTMTAVVIMIMILLAFLLGVVVYSVCKGVECKSRFLKRFRNSSGLQWTSWGGLGSSSSDVRIELSTPNPKKRRVRTRISDALVIEDF